jgi:hypothetical protein
MRSRRAKSKAFTFIAALAVIALVLFALSNVHVIVWDGSFPLQVTLVGPPDPTIVGVADEVLICKTYAADLKIDPRRLHLHPDHVDWIEGQPFTVRVPCSGRQSQPGVETSYLQFQLLVLRLEYKDGDIEYISAEIPDGRKSHEVTLSVTKQQQVH